jgi:GTP-binding protein YchF
MVILLELLISNDDEFILLSSFNLITMKPVLYVCNVDENSVLKGNDYVNKVLEATKNEGAEVLIIATAIEAEIADLESIDEQLLFLEEMGLDQPGVNKLIRSTYKLLNLQTYFTAGEKEVRAWTIVNGTKAPQAAAVIHTDFEKGFIRAEVISYENFIKFGSEQICRENGKLSVEGKDYVVNDGDIMHFRFNV